MTPEHRDQSVFNRWVNVVPPPPLPLAATATRPLKGQIRKIKTPEVQDEEIPMSEDSFWEEYKNQTLEWAEDVQPEGEFVQYVRRQSGFVLPPVNENGHPSESDLTLIFQQEGKPGQTDKYSPYAFGGPRIIAPYRPLHRIHPPSPSDISAWAENLRWVAEQVSTFPDGPTIEFPAVKGWNESPEHMIIISKHRMRQEWVSDEWLQHCVQREEERKRQTRNGQPGRLEKWRIDVQPVEMKSTMSVETLAELGIYNPPSPNDRFFENGTYDIPYTGPLVPEENQHSPKQGDQANGKINIDGVWNLPADDLPSSGDRRVGESEHAEFDFGMMI